MERLRIIAAAAGLLGATIAPPPLFAGAASAADEPTRISSAVALQSVVTREEPEYPPMARGMRLEGAVAVDAVIDERGKVVEVEPVDGHPVLSHAVQRALRHWRFKPIRVAGEPIRAVARLHFKFAP